MWPKTLVLCLAAVSLVAADSLPENDSPAVETSTLAITTESPKEDPISECLKPPPELECSSANYTNNSSSCRLDALNTTMVCCRIRRFILFENFGIHKHANISRLFIYNSTFDLDVTNSFFKSLTSFSFVNGQLNITGNFSSSIRCLNLSGNIISKDSYFNFTLAMENLTILDLSRNNLTLLPTINPEVKHLQFDASGNPQLLCGEIKNLMKNITNLEILHINQSFCINYLKFRWFTSNDTFTFEHILAINNLDENCPRSKNGSWECKCYVYRLDFVENKPPVASFNVDCSRQNMTELPLLPENTIFLNLSSNNISSLKRINRQSYSQVRFLDLDNNNITDINDLEGRLIQNFLYLSLRNNSIKRLPTYFLSDAIDRNLQEREIYLGGNLLDCDCGTVQQDMVWLKSNSKHVLDIDQIGCNNFPEKVIHLQKTKVCLYKRVWTDYIYYIIAGEVALLIFLITKVSYDYWVFKTAGYLPWPANKMPKLPCDWLFEV